MYDIITSVSVGLPPFIAIPPPPRASPSGMRLFDISQDSIIALELTSPIPPPTLRAVLFLTCRSFKYGLAFPIEIPPCPDH